MINLEGYKSGEELLDILSCKEAKVFINVCNQEYTIASTLCTSHEEGFINKKIVTNYTFKLVPIFRKPLSIKDIEGVNVFEGTYLRNKGKKYVVSEINKGVITAKLLETESEAEYRNLGARISKLEEFMSKQKYGDGAIEKPGMF